MSSYAWLAENLSIPIVGPESFGGKHHMRAEWVKAGACDILRAGANGVGITPTMKVAALAESFGMDCEVHGNGAASPAVVGAIRTAAGTSAARCIRSSTTMNRRPISTALSTRWMTEDLCICHNVRVSVKTLILRISKPIPLATTDLKNKYPMALRLSSLRPGRPDKPKMPPSGNMYPTVQANRDMKKPPYWERVFSRSPCRWGAGRRWRKRRPTS